MEEKIFKRRRPVRGRLLQHGFRETADGLRYETEFVDRENAVWFIRKGCGSV